MAGGQRRSVTDGDRGDHKVDAALAARRSASGGNEGAEFAVDIGFALGEGQPLAVDRTVPDEFDTGLGGDAGVGMRSALVNSAKEIAETRN